MRRLRIVWLSEMTFQSKTIAGHSLKVVCCVYQTILNTTTRFVRGTQRQFSENICSEEDDLKSRIFGTFVVKFLACLPLLGFSNILKLVFLPIFIRFLP